MENLSDKRKIQKIHTCACGHPLELHFEKGCYGTDDKGRMCSCAFDYMEAKAKAYESQLDQVLKVLNNK